MFEGNAGLKPKEGEVTSRPWQWPIDMRGQYFSGSSYRIYLLGNPIIWWGNLGLLLLFLGLYAFHAWREQRGTYLEEDNKKDERERTVSTCLWLFIGWALHYLPFYTMGRVLYFHHYFPALLFSSMLSGVVLDYFFQTVACHFGKGSFHLLYGACLSGIGYSFFLFSPLAYGANGPLAGESNSTMYGLKWLESWEF